MEIFTEEQRHALKEAGGWSPKKAASIGGAYAMTLPGEGMSGDLKFGLSEFDGAAKRFLQAAKSGNPNTVKRPMMQIISTLAAVARETEGLEQIRIPLSKIVRKYGRSMYGG